MTYDYDDRLMLAQDAAHDRPLVPPCACCGDAMAPGDIAGPWHWLYADALAQRHGGLICESCADSHDECDGCGDLHRTDALTAPLHDGALCEECRPFVDADEACDLVREGV